MNALIAYYTWSGNTGRLASLIAQETGGDLFEIRPAEPYPPAYNACVEQVKREIGAGHRPALEAWPADLDAYDTVFVGTPSWWSTLAPPVAAFLKGLDLSGKTVVPFCTHGGGGQARCASDTAALCPHSKIAKGLATYNDVAGRQEVAGWLARIGVKRA